LASGYLGSKTRHQHAVIDPAERFFEIQTGHVRRSAQYAVAPELPANEQYPSGEDRIMNALACVQSDLPARSPMIFRRVSMPKSVKAKGGVSPIR